MSKENSNRILISSKRRLLDYRGFMRIDEYDFSFITANAEAGRTEKAVNVDRGNAIAILVHIAGSQHKLRLVRQFRLSTVLGPDHAAATLPTEVVLTDAAILELPAVVRKDNETVEDAIRRAALNEACVRVESFENVSSFYPSTGACSEKIDLFYVQVSAEDDDETVQRPGRSLELVDFSPREFFEAIERGTICDGKCFVAAEWMRRDAVRDRFGI